jgi:Fe-Mn family superoxide dismutase
MKFELPPLPYAKSALEPHMSRETLEYHYEKHHRGYLAKLEEAIEGTPQEKNSLEEIIRNSEGPVFNNAAQVWNHTFFWNCMEPNGGGEPGGDVAKAIRECFGSYGEFRDQFVDAGETHFGSGYVWVILGDRHDMRIITTHDAENPLKMELTPLLTCDLWEHAYYLDHRNERAKYLEAFVGHLVNWDRIAASLKKAA